MAITGVIEAWEVGGESTETGGNTTRVFQVMCDNVLVDKPWRVLNYEHPNLPIVGEIYPPIDAIPTPKELFMRARSRRMQSGSRFPLFKIEIPYRTDIGFHEIDPVSEYPDTLYDTEAAREPIDTDVGGNPIQMSNLEGLDPKLETRLSDMVQRVSTKVAYFSQLDWAEPFIDTVNEEDTTIDWVDSPIGNGQTERTALIAPAGTLLIEKIGGHRVFFGPKAAPDYVYHEVNAQSRIRTTVDPVTGFPIFHLLRVRDEGYRELLGWTIGKPMFGDIVQGVKTVRKPVALDGSGRVLAQGATPWWHRWKVNADGDHKKFFTYLGIQQSE